MRPFALLVATAALAAPLAAQAPRAVEPTMMKSLDWIVGNWTGSGSMVIGPGEPVQAEVKETGSRHAGGHVVTFQGLGTLDGAVVHDAFGVIWYDAEAKVHRMRAFRATGHVVDADITITDGRIVWGFKDPRAGQIRFTVSHTADDKWHEIGERSADGTTWQKFFEMSLSREPAT